MPTISLNKAIQNQNQGQGLIIDVREPAEFRDGHLPGAINLPSTKFNENDYQTLNSPEFYIICQTGNRAQIIAQKLEEAGNSKVFVLKEHMEYITAEQTHEGWSVDRQFRFFLGVLITLYLIGSALGLAWVTVIPFILGAGLIITAIIDKCYLRIGIAMLPWNARERHIVS